MVGNNSPPQPIMHIRVLIINPSTFKAVLKSMSKWSHFDILPEQGFNPKNLKEIVMDVYHYPSKYTEILIKLMERYNSEHKYKS
jgi:hypothetical protein